jgi:hypothetical protein
VLDDSFVLVILGRKLKSEQGQGEGGHGRRGAGPWELGVGSQPDSWPVSVTNLSPSSEGIDTIRH